MEASAGAQRPQFIKDDASVFFTSMAASASAVCERVNCNCKGLSLASFKPDALQNNSSARRCSEQTDMHFGNFQQGRSCSPAEPWRR